jgi:hypothetical protein
MNNDALVAALGMDAVAAVDGYRRAVVAEAERQGIRLVSGALSAIVRDRGQAHIIDPIDIRLGFGHCPGRPELAGRELRWDPAHGWSISHGTAGGPLAHYAEPGSAPLLLVPTAPEVVLWATEEIDGPVAPPTGVELDDDPRAVRRLLAFIRAASHWHSGEAFSPDPLAHRTRWRWTG